MGFLDTVGSLIPSPEYQTTHPPNIRYSHYMVYSDIVGYVVNCDIVVVFNIRGAGRGWGD